MRRIRWFLPCIGLVFLVACRPLLTPLAMPPGLQASGDRLPIHGGVNVFQHTVKFGPYAARNAWAGLEYEKVLKRATNANNQVEQSVIKQRATFDFHVPVGTPFLGDCQRETVVFTQYFKGGLFGLGKEQAPPQVIQRDRRTWCTIKRKGGGTMRFATEGPNSFEVFGASSKLTLSSLANGASPYEMPASENAFGSNDVGYSLELGSLSVAAVDLTYSAAVTLHASLSPDQRDEAAAVCMALYMTNAMDD